MYPVSQKYKDGIYATERMNKGRVTFDLSDVSAAGDVSSIVATSESTLSNKSQLSNNIRSASYRLATNEQDRVKLNGSFSFADDVIANNGELGWVSDLICDSNGTFTTPPSVTINFNGNHSSIGLTVTFDDVNGEYATDFVMTAYDASDNLIASYPYTNNTLTQVAAYGQLTNYRKVVLTISKWSVPNRRARVSEVSFGIVKVYTGETGLVSMGLTEEMDLTSSNIPSPEFKFTVDNSSREFNILNPVGFYKSLQQKQQVIGEIGLTTSDGLIEWIPVGNYLLSEWQSDEGSLTATFFARTLLDQMANFTYSNTVPTTTSLGSFAQAIFAICGVTNYNIDPALFTINTTQLIGQGTDCKKVLQMIAMAGCANVYVTRDNVITIKVLPAPTVDVDTVSMNDQYSEPKIILDNVTAKVDVTYWTDLNTSGISSVNNGLTGDVYKLEGNTLINSAARATAVANWILAQKNYRATYTINWRGNQAHEQGDVIGIGNSYGQDMNAYITKTELKYEGYVQATTEAKGAVN